MGFIFSYYVPRGNDEKLPSSQEFAPMIDGPDNERGSLLAYKPQILTFSNQLVERVQKPTCGRNHKGVLIRTTMTGKHAIWVQPKCSKAKKLRNIYGMAASVPRENEITLIIYERGLFGRQFRLKHRVDKRKVSAAGLTGRGGLFFTTKPIRAIPHVPNQKPHAISYYDTLRTFSSSRGMTSGPPIRY